MLFRSAWKQLGVTFSRTTMARWIIRCAEDWLEPLWNAMRKELLQREVLHADETVVQVLKENGKTAQSKSYMWVYRTGMDGLPPLFCTSTSPDAAVNTQRSFWRGFTDTCIPTAMRARVTPKFCVKSNECRNRAKFICRRQRLDRLPPMSTT